VNVGHTLICECSCDSRTVPAAPAASVLFHSKYVQNSPLSVPGLQPASNPVPPAIPSAHVGMLSSGVASTAASSTPQGNTSKPASHLGFYEREQKRIMRQYLSNGTANPAISSLAGVLQSYAVSPTRITAEGYRTWGNSTCDCRRGSLASVFQRTEGYRRGVASNEELDAHQSCTSLYHWLVFLNLTENPK
jgi:hypothetical protein